MEDVNGVLVPVIRDVALNCAIRKRSKSSAMRSCLKACGKIIHKSPNLNALIDATIDVVYNAYKRGEYGHQ
jgi:hypothetical protein